ncbi:MAG: phosphoribosylformylglycinamidine cyclo-ligase [Candidatus ainarchaeum sp.]|nr:phosphoribosylformylglycinamidine cyclo-ligase [Candidatus ainarchaeum sp.]
MKSYSEAGVDVNKVKSMQNMINRTIFAGKQGALVGHYAGIVDLKGRRLAMHTDGVGSKVLVAQAMEKYDTIGIDAIAMNVNDIICVGATPLAGVDYLALSTEDAELVEDILKGLMAGARESGIDIVGGETAILPDIIKGGARPFDLAFTAIGEIGRELITGNSIKSGDLILGLESSGLHSNGYTLARRVLDIKKWGPGMLEPTRIYVKPVLEMISSCTVDGLAHITGGAFSKLMRLNKKRGFLLDNMPEPAPIFQALAEEVDEREMHRTFNMGIGMCVIADMKCADQVLGIAKKYKIGASVIGSITPEPGVWLQKGGKKTRLD